MRLPKEQGNEENYTVLSSILTGYGHGRENYIKDDLVSGEVG